MGKIKSTLFFVLFLAQFGYSQALKFDRTNLILSNIKDYNIHKLIYKFTNETKDTLEISIVPKTFLTNPIMEKVKFAPGESGKVVLEFYPKKTGSFREIVNVKANGDMVTQLTYSGYISNFSQEYIALIQNHQLSSDKDIVFMIVDATNYEYLPNAKINILNTKNFKAYVGTTDQNGVLKDKLPVGQYSITALIEGYENEIVGTQVEPRRNAALILVQKKKNIALQLLYTDIKNYLRPKLETSPKNYVKEPVILPILTLPKDTAIVLKPKVEPISTPIVTLPKIDTIPKIQTPSNIETDTLYSYNIVLLLDISLSMNKHDRIGILKKSIQYMVKNYKQNDKLGIILFNDSSYNIYPLDYIKNKEQVLSLIDSIKTSGKTNGVGSITVAIEELKKNQNPNAINMIILSTDGKITPDPNDFRLIYDKVEAMRKEGNYFSALSFGANSYDDRLMMRLAEVGGGIYFNYKSNESSTESLLMDKINENLNKKNKPH